MQSNVGYTWSDILGGQQKGPVLLLKLLDKTAELDRTIALILTSISKNELTMGHYDPSTPHPFFFFFLKQTSFSRNMEAMLSSSIITSSGLEPFSGRSDENMNCLKPPEMVLKSYRK